MDSVKFGVFLSSIVFWISYLAAPTTAGKNPACETYGKATGEVKFWSSGLIENGKKVWTATKNTFTDASSCLKSEGLFTGSTWADDKKGMLEVSGFEMLIKEEGKDQAIAYLCEMRKC